MNSHSKTASQQLAECLHAEIPELRLAKVLSDALVATLTNRSGIIEPDQKTRLQAAALILSYKVGRPVERQEVVSLNVGESADTDVSSRLRKSPALRRLFRKILDEAGD